MNRRMLLAAAVLAATLGLVSSANAQWYGARYYNPYTGTSAASHGAYNPYTGGAYHSTNAYNPYTGTSHHSQSWYNPYTNTLHHSGASYNHYTGNYSWHRSTRHF